MPIFTPEGSGVSRSTGESIMNRMFITIVKGKLELHADNKPKGVYELTDIEGPAFYLLCHAAEVYQCSSSVDFPQDDGAHADFRWTPHWNAIVARAEEIDEAEAKPVPFPHTCAVCGEENVPHFSFTVPSRDHRLTARHLQAHGLAELFSSKP